MGKGSFTPRLDGFTPLRVFWTRPLSLLDLPVGSSTLPWSPSRVFEKKETFLHRCIPRRIVHLSDRHRIYSNRCWNTFDRARQSLRISWRLIIENQPYDWEFPRPRSYFLDDRLVEKNWLVFLAHIISYLAPGDQNADDYQHEYWMRILMPYLTNHSQSPLTVSLDLVWILKKRKSLMKTRNKRMQMEKSLIPSSPNRFCLDIGWLVCVRAIS